ncbi:hypothetical protein QOZ80_6BG0484060 [Eleusine coracana subsp. coracana]|nr:hypothetical protein QOZ80_6BG0484060 [Eleusine coracana subsp. coracana]
MEGDAAAAAEAAARIRVVRCPKCDKFLPELPAYSIYVCGGCGATLQAKKKNSDHSSHESDNRNVKYLEVLECVSEVSETMPGASTAGRLENKNLPDVCSKSVFSHHDNMQKPAAANLKATVRDDGRETKYRHFRDWENREMGRSLRVRDISPRPPIDSIPTSAYRGEGLVDYHSKSRYRYSNREHSDGTAFDGPSRVRGLEKDRAEILRMLDELRDQVKQSCDVTDEPSGIDPISRAPDAPSSYGTSILKPMRFLGYQVCHTMRIVDFLHLMVLEWEAEVPILNLKRKAEKLSGAIYPGDYWYDYRAGFWGVMGRPCLGMIPPYIPEFNYPMPKNCAGGNTGVFVNGRELHQKDLDLLVARGLADSPGRSYIVENSGKVSDEGTGEELYGLGKLAPTVEKMRRGFGMRVPRFIQ